MSPSTSSSTPFHVAIIGGGIAGLTLAIGLQERGVSYTVYERAPTLADVGAGIGFSPNAERAMTLLAPAVHAAFKRVANPNGEDYFQWVDGLRDELIYRLYVGKDQFQGCRRADFQAELARLVPEEKIRLGKGLEEVVEEKDGRVRMKFSDGSLERADVVIACDGIRSRVRQLILGADNPAAFASYTHKFCFRALVPMEEAVAAIGEYKASTRFMYNGPDAHIITYPVAGNTLLNVLAVISDPNPWHLRVEAEEPRTTQMPAMNGNSSGEHDVDITMTDTDSNLHPTNGNGTIRGEPEMADASPSPPSSSSSTTPTPSSAPPRPKRHKHTAPGSKSEAISAFSAWYPTVRAIVSLLPEQMDKWAIFDMEQHPAASYARGSVCLAGDAAHAVGPHLGSGGGMAVEDALCLAALLEEVARRTGTDAVAGGATAGGGGGVVGAGRGKVDHTRAEMVRDALAVYSDVRYRRTQEVVRSTRAICDLFEWKDGPTDPEVYGAEVTRRFHYVWDYDVEGMVRQAVDEFEVRSSDSAFL